MLEATLITSIEESDIAAYEERLRKEEEALRAAEEAAALEEDDPEEGYQPVNPITGSIGTITTDLAPELAAMVPSYMSYNHGAQQEALRADRSPDR